MVEDKCIVVDVSVLLRAMQNAHAACEAALTRIEPMYDADICDAVCVKMVENTLCHARAVAAALEFASTQNADWFESLSLPQRDALCGEPAMRAALDVENIGALALGVVLLAESDAIAPRGLFVYAMKSQTSIHVLRILMSSQMLLETITDYEDSNYTPLMFAAQHGHTQAIEMLLACPAVVASANVVNVHGNTALMLASDVGRVEVVKALLACPAIIESAGAVSPFGFTALMFASMCVWLRTGC